MPMEIEAQEARCSVRKKKKKRAKAKPMADKGLKKRKGKESKTTKLNDDEAKDEITAAPAPETVTMELDLIEHYLVGEVARYMTGALLCPILHLKHLAPFEKDVEFSANILKQRRLTNGPVELQMDPITTSDDHHDDELIDRRGWMNWRTPEERAKRMLEEEQEELEDEARWKNKLKEEA
uniref:Uncharacterized protein n=1 Tax=Oryza barthii TaxID=65489 RepID=A0A0D3HF30_9ORYZ